MAFPRMKRDPSAKQADDARFRLLVENIGDVLWFKKLAPERFSYISPAVERIWGISIAELQENPRLWEAAIHPEDRKTVRKARKQWFSGETTEYEVSYRIIARDGHMRWIADRGIILDRKGGKPYQIGGIARDVTEHAASEAVRHRLAAVVESSDDAIISLDLDGVIQTWNAAAQHIFQYTAKEAVGKPVAILRPQEAADDEAVFRREIRRGKRIHHYETKRRRKDGRIIDVSLTLSPLLDHGGRITGFSKISREITEQKLAERRFHDVLEAAPDALIITDRRGVIQMVNAQAQRLFGYRREQMIGQRAEMFLLKDQRTSHARQRREFLGNPHQRERFRGLEQTGLRKDGSRFPMEINLGQLQTSDGIYIISDIIDITARKQAEQAIHQLNADLEQRVRERTVELEKANAELRGLITLRRQLEEEILRISEHEQRRIGQDLHDDLGQQLAGAWMMSSVLQRGLKKRAAPEAADAAGISNLLENALAQTRSLARGLHPVSEADGGLMSALQDLATRSTAMFGIRCQWKCPSPVLVEDQTTATHLYRIAQEAVSNAVKHGGAETVRVSLIRSAGSISLSVHDDGCGITLPSPGHQGMGLRIMRYRADLIHADLTIVKGPQRGTHLTCILPDSTLTKKTSHGQKSTHKSPQRTAKKSSHRR